MTKVAICREKMVCSSETFIYAQAQFFLEYKVKFFSICLENNPMVNSLRIFFLNSGSIIGKLREICYKLTGNSSLFKKKIREFNPDIIHIHYGTDAARMLKILKDIKKPFIVTFHGYDSNTTDEWKKKSKVLLFKTYLKKRSELIKEAAGFIAVSEYVKNKLLEKNYPIEKIYVCPIGIDLDLFQYQPKTVREKSVLFVGRICENKGLSYLIEAMQKIQNQDSTVRLVIAGTGPQIEEMKVYASKKLNNYQFLGAVSHQEVKNLMSTSMVFCVPTIELLSGESESFGMVFAEAQAVGTPVVSFNTGGIPNVVLSGKTGFLCQQKDVEGLNHNISMLLNDPILWKKFSINGREHISNSFDIKDTTRKLEIIYDKIIKSWESIAI